MDKYGIKKKSEVNKRSNSALSSIKLTFYLAMFVSSIIFIYLLLAHLATPLKEAAYFSKYFSLSTIVLLLSLYPVSQLISAYDNEKGHSVLNGLLLSTLSGFFFMTFHIVAWMDMMNQQVSPYNLIFVVTGLHGTYVLSLTILTIYHYFFFSSKLKDPVQKLITCTNPFERMKLEITSQSWYFIQVSWVMIYLMLKFVN